MLKRLVVCGVALAMAGVPAVAAEKIVFQLGWLPGGDKAAVYVGVHQGLFAKAGLDVEIRSGRGSTDTITKAGTGAIDLGEASLGSVMQAKASSEVPVVAVMPIFTKQPDALLVDEGGPVKTLKDIEGKTVATSAFTSSNLYWPIVLEANKIDVGKVTLLKADPAALPALLATGQVAGTINWVTSAAGTAAALKSAKKGMRELSWSDYGFEGYAQSIVASTNLLKQRPQAVKSFLTVYRQAMQIMKADPNAAVVAMRAMVPELDPVTIRTDVDAALPLMFNGETDRAGLGKFDPKLVATTWVWVAKSLNMPESKIDPQTTIDAAFIN